MNNDETLIDKTQIETDKLEQKRGKWRSYYHLNREKKLLMMKESRKLKKQIKSKDDNDSNVPQKIETRGRKRLPVTDKVE